MPYVLRRMRIEDFDRGKRTWDETAAMRRGLGVKSEQLFRNADDPQDALALYEYDTMEQAHQHGQASQAREARQRGGVTVVATYFPAD